MYKLTGWEHHLHKVKIMWEKCVTFTSSPTCVFCWCSWSCFSGFPWAPDFRTALFELSWSHVETFFTQEGHPTRKTNLFQWKTGSARGFRMYNHTQNKEDIPCKPYIHILPALDNHIPPISIFDRCVLPFWELLRTGSSQGVVLTVWLMGEPAGANCVGIIGGSGCH